MSHIVITKRDILQRINLPMHGIWGGDQPYAFRESQLYKRLMPAAPQRQSRDLTVCFFGLPYP